jgi:hypothetical protein
VAAYTYYEPQRAGVANFPSPVEIGYFQAQNAAFKRGDFLQLITTNSATTPNPNGSISTAIGPTTTAINLISTSTSVTVGAVTISGVASTGAPAATYYTYFTYTGAASIESLPGLEFIINCAPGIVPRAVVTSSGSPANSTGTAWYGGVIPGYEVQQVAATAFGSNMTFTYPLTNNIGVNRSITNPNTNIVGLALNSSLALFFQGTGGSFMVNEAGQFGATNSLYPLTPTESLLNYVDKLQNGYLFEISLKQGWYQALQGTTAGLTLDATTGIWILDTSVSHAICTIVNVAQSVTAQPFGQPVPATGINPGDTGSRVIAYVSTASALV